MPYRAPSATDELIVTPDKQMAMVGIGGGFQLRDDDADFPAMQMVDFLFGGSPSSRLFERLRQKDGLSYGAGSFLDADAFDKNSLFLAFAICAPQNAVKAMAGMMEELNALIQKGVEQKELTDAKQKYKAQFDTALASDDTIVGLLDESLNVGRKLDYYDKLMGSVQADRAGSGGRARQVCEGGRVREGQGGRHQAGRSASTISLLQRTAAVGAALADGSGCALAKRAPSIS